MTTLQTQNYIHTLFVCHFGVPFNATMIIRIYLQKNVFKQDLYADWVNSIISQLPIPKSRYENHWVLFESDADMTSYDNWRQNKIPARNPVKYLRASQFFLLERFSIYLQGLTNNYFLEVRETFGKIEYNRVFLRHQMDYNPRTEKLDEKMFYLEVVHLLDILKNTNKIPFKLFNVK